MLTAYYQISRFDKEHRLKKKYVRRISRSFVKQFIEMFYVCCSGATYGIHDTGNVSRSVGGSLNYPDHFYCNGNGGGTYQSFVISNSLYNVPSEQIGIVLGTGNTAVTPSDYKLGTLIAHGTGSGQLMYHGMFFPSNATVSGSSCTFDIERIYKNSSGGDVTINEIGIYCIGRYQNSLFCIVRDVLASPVTVANGEYLKVTYTISVSV